MCCCDDKDVRSFGAIFDGDSHSLRSVGYATLAAAQVDFPFATDIDINEIDRCAVQKAVNSLPDATHGLAGGSICLPDGKGVFDWPVQIPASRVANIRGGGKYATSFSYNTNAGRSFTSGPIFAVYPLSYSRPVFVDGAPGGKRGLKFTPQGALSSSTCYLNLSDYAGCDLGTQTKVTMKADIRIDEAPGADAQNVFGCGGGLSTNEFQSYLYNLSIYTDGNGHLTAFIFCKVDGSNYAGSADISDVVALGEWHNFKAIRTGTTLTLSIDDASPVITVTGCPSPIVQQFWESHFLGIVPTIWPDGGGGVSFKGAIASPQLLDQTDTVVIAPDFSEASNPNDPVETDKQGIIIPADLPNFGGGGFRCLLVFRDNVYRGDTSFSASGLGFIDATFGIFMSGVHAGHITDWFANQTRFPVYLLTNCFQNEIDDFDVKLASAAVTCCNNSGVLNVTNGLIGLSMVGLMSSESSVVYDNCFTFNMGFAAVVACGGGAANGKQSINNILITDEPGLSATGYGFVIFGGQQTDIRGCQINFGSYPKVGILLSNMGQATIENTLFSLKADAPYCIQFSAASAAPNYRIPVMPVIVGNQVPLTNRPLWIVDERMNVHV